MKVDIKDIIDNEREWRRVMYKEITEIRRELFGMRVKVASFGSVFGILGAIFVEWIKDRIK